MSELIQTERHDRVLVVRINRPERKNALNHAMYTALADALQNAENDADIRCTLFTGTSDCFTAGNDLSDFAEGLPGEFESTPVGRFLFGLANAAKPVVAAVNGPAVGIGTTMLLHCDLVFAGSNTRFQMPFANLGLCPEGGSSLLLPMWLGRARASELLMLGGAFTAEQADRLGLINRICEPETTEQTALDTCKALAAQPPAAIRATKALITRPNKETLSATLLAEGELFGERLKSAEAAEAFAAFKEKRKPDFSQFD
ncbi:enoyl-CoA hydratase [Marinobacter nanhaiticus D15-8W]|uniref:Enoyl-CoA hydratase n=1 Tax=Marinobacter nanhaiticus D15-8W TaxID=626887 RepID=N6WPN6_9GAMM|nr:enoyl-CoA hydratase [Marinobacter nanhaiticus]ENO13546.1 enoyl-CoA hydratase [Marinobacter nanhaiticus D15-8W]BES70915.1 enoyl-CoA hydratase [Marinobacter nanhaiticus D15-8W]